MYIATVLVCLLIILIFFLSGYTDNIFRILIWCPRQLNNESIYTLVAVKIQIFNDFTIARLLVLRPYEYAYGSLRV